MQQLGHRKSTINEREKGSVKSVSEDVDGIIEGGDGLVGIIEAKRILEICGDVVAVGKFGGQDEAEVLNDGISGITAMGSGSDGKRGAFRWRKQGKMFFVGEICHELG